MKGYYQQLQDLRKLPISSLKNVFYFGHLVYLNSLIKIIFCLDLRVFRKSLVIIPSKDCTFRLQPMAVL
ncbi:hypothetical protein DGG96_13180 [Legionella qingyii]|uniref:Uncharacterized protein n=1 Tax=Legionella qingyii TaxID=2184757 RepID=A0A317U442_9GAMM|nr:hypothetical protein DGG96_13180 [Legionella qingyii]RUR25447.1 hypothetical protein ELY20_03035 [Legionella qingyii]